MLGRWTFLLGRPIFRCELLVSGRVAVGLQPALIHDEVGIS